MKLLLIVSVSLSLSQQEGIEQKRPKSIVVNKPVNIKEIIRYGEKGGDAKRESRLKNRSSLSMPSLPTMVSTDASLRRTKILSPMNTEADNNTGRAIVCGAYNFLAFIIMVHLKEKKKRYVIRKHNYFNFYLRDCPRQNKDMS